MAKKKEPGFEEQLAELEGIVRQMDSEDLPLEQAIEAYEKGVKLSFRLNKILEEAQRKVEILTRTADGGMVAEPFAEDESEDA